MLLKIKNSSTILAAWFRKCWRIMVAAAFSFWNDDCYTKASTLTFYLLQSIVPLIAFLLGIAKGFGFEKYLEQFLTNTFTEQKEVLSYIIQIAYALLQNIQGGVIVGFGALFLLYTNITLLGYIEVVLNQIWKIENPRSLFRKFSDYLATILICPFILVASSSLTFYIKSQIAHLHEYAIFATFSDYLIWLFTLVPFVLNWILFCFLYFLMPNAKLSIWPRIFAALLAGCAFQLWQVIYFNAQIYLFNYNTIYGAFAALPLFLIWLQVSWLIALGGAEISAHIENDIVFDTPSAGENIVKISQNELGILILYHCYLAFYSCKLPLSDLQISHLLKIPLDITQKMLKILTVGDILTPIELKKGGIGFLPLFDPENFTLQEICSTIAHNFDFETLVEKTAVLDQISAHLKGLKQTEKNSLSNIRLKDLITIKNKALPD